jgi:hypothetical protein
MAYKRVIPFGVSSQPTGGPAVAARTARRSRPDRQAPRRPRHPDRTGHAHPGRPRRTPPPARRTAARRPRRTAVPFAAQVAQVVGVAELEYLGLAADRVGELAAQRGTSSRQEPIPGRPATSDCLSLLTQSTVLGASANPWHPHGPRVRAPRDLPRPPVRAMARVSPEPEPCRRARAAGRSGASAASCRGRGRADAPTPGGLGGCVRAPGRHRPAQGSGSARSPPGERIDPGRLSLCRSPFCPTAALLLPGRGRADPWPVDLHPFGEAWRWGGGGVQRIGA